MQDMINGYETGYRKGIQENNKQVIEKMVKQMKKEKIDIRTILKITGLTEDEINKID